MVAPTPPTFEPGQRVIVHPDSPEVLARFRDTRPDWEGDVVGYWRDGLWIVRELEHHTTAAFAGSRLELAPDRCATLAPHVPGEPSRL